MRDQAKYAIDFKRKGGSELLFYDKVQEYMKKIATYGCNDTTLESEN